MNPEKFVTRLNRRSFLSNVSLGVGSLALGSMLDASGLAKRPSLGVIDPLHFAPKAKRVIEVFCMKSSYKLKIYRFEK